ncbi:type I DNA topoisomerase [Thermoplasmatales archaeon SW_10_69_26]|nr:MAG: type I DNA topoisomerase [Thermoplasmatales archaeon SW_10_69_26]
MPVTKLVIVESPAKVDTVQQYLPSEYEVDSCVGHVRDLPRNADDAPAHVQDEDWADYGVNVDDGFEPIYVTVDGKRDVIQRLRKRLREADELYLATDEDREGESISWHLVEALDPDVPVKRMVFNEITKNAVEAALEDPRDLDMDLVEAQETRRILDRLYGYTISPLLWDKVDAGNEWLSAGRVQSPAVRLVVMRERERRAFTSAEYWDLQALLSDQGERFGATLFALDGTRLATGEDFDRSTGELEPGADRIVLDEDQARDLVDELEPLPWEIADVNERPRQSSPPAPFKTSTLQKAANSRLNMSPGHAMSVAQDLYEDGHITYMRTDSTHLSEEGVEGARKAIADEWSTNLYEGPRSHGGSTADEAEEAHEAIRPAGSTFEAPDDTGLTGRHEQLYDLIYRRTLASQMPNERYTSNTAFVDAGRARFKATGKQVDVAGYRLAWPTKSDANQLPELTPGDQVTLENLEPDGHETKPPKRYTEASLVDALEEEGIGRPSTYASIISRIQEKDYVDKHGRSLVPTLTAFAVVTFLEEHFPHLVEMGFTADMEQTLDRIATGEAEARPYLEAFFLGDDGLQARVDAKDEEVDGSQARAITFEDLDYTIKLGRYGPYVEHDPPDGETVRANLPDDLTPDEIDEDLVQRVIEEEAHTAQDLGEDPATGDEIHLLDGRYGYYVQRGHPEEVDDPDRASLPEDLSPDEVDRELASWLLSLPAEIGDHPDGGEVLVGIGRYGPYVRHDDPSGDQTYENVDDWRQLQDLSLEAALDVLEEPALGSHPDTGQPVFLRDGRYGPYVQLGDADEVEGKPPRASLPEDLDPDQVDVELAAWLLSLPAGIGDHPDGGEVLVGIGRYGPYVRRDDPSGDQTYENVDDWRQLRGLELEEALAVLGDGADDTSPFGKLGSHPDTGQPIELRDGRYGPYVSHGDDNNSLPDEMTPDEVTLDDAVFLVGLPETLGEAPNGDTLLKDLGRYGPYVARKDAGGDRTYVSLVDYRDLVKTQREDALFCLDLPERLGDHPEGGTVHVDRDRDGLYLEHRDEGGQTLKEVRGLRAPALREMALAEALAHL